MLALVLFKAHDLRLESVPVPQPPSKWALIKTIAVGICGTDKAFFTGSYPLLKKPIILGHEVSGIVVKGSNKLEGKIVVPEINFPCDSCQYCRSGLYTHCPHRKVLGINFDGAMAEYFIAPITALHVVEDLDPIIAVEVEPLAAIINALEQFPPRPCDEIAVIGSGNIAILTIQLLRSMGFDVTAIVRKDSPKIRYVSKYATHILTVEEIEQCTDIFKKRGFSYIFEVSSDPNAINIAISIARPRALIHVKSTPGSYGKINLTPAVVKELRIVGTRCGSFREFEKAINILREGVVEPPITNVVKGLERGVEAFKLAFQRDQIKVVIKVHDHEVYERHS